MLDNNPLNHNELDWLFDEEDFISEILDPSEISNAIPMFFDYCEEPLINLDNLNYPDE